MPRQGQLSGKTAIVTGSSRSNGIGAAIAVALAEQGANIVVHYVKSEQGATEVVNTLQGMGVKAVAIQADAASADLGTKLVQGTLEAPQVSTIDILINNAGISRIHPGIAEVPLGAWDEIFHTNVRAPFLLIQAALPYMQAGGRIVNIGSIIGSIIGKMGHRVFTVYGASKGALASMSVSMAEELGARGITINVVAPGPIDTDMKEAGVNEKLFRNMHIKREGTPREVAGAVAWLAGPDAGFVTGQLIPIDGGSGWP
ncbi:hypothetical protein PG985_011070 [Apiospora marii]|uniref:Uncharacterized protein n=1 Tax=Apiospora marii TaxID=335849 RepID=A0ABR1SUF7_9PEZI